MMECDYETILNELNSHNEYTFFINDIPYRTETPQIEKENMSFWSFNVVDESFAAEINKLKDASGNPMKVGDIIEYKGRYVYE